MLPPSMRRRYGTASDSTSRVASLAANVLKIRRKLDRGIEEYSVLNVERNSTCLFGQLACLADPTCDPRSHGLNVVGHAYRVVAPCAGVSAHGAARHGSILPGREWYGSTHLHPRVGPFVRIG